MVTLSTLFFSLVISNLYSSSIKSELRKFSRYSLLTTTGFASHSIYDTEVVPFMFLLTVTQDVNVLYALFLVIFTMDLLLLSAFIKSQFWRCF